MKRTVSLLVFVALLVLAGCSDTGAVAASVNGHDISSDTVTRGAHAFGESEHGEQEVARTDGEGLVHEGTVSRVPAARSGICRRRR